MPGGHLWQGRHKPVTATITTAEHERLAELAKRAGKKPTPYVTEILRKHLSEQENAA